MAKNLTTRATLATITCKNEVTGIVFHTKEAMDQYLFTLAVDNWNLKSARPNSRKATIDQFFSANTNNYLAVEPVSLMSNEGVQQRYKRTMQKINGNKEASKEGNKELAVGRSR